MPRFDTLVEAQSTKMLYLGDSGAGKTGSLCSLVADGYNVRILDLDKGVEIMKDYLTNPESPYVKPRAGHWKSDPKGLLDRASFVSITESMTIKGTSPIPKGDAWQKINNQLNDWNDGDLKLGNIDTWGRTDILVIDGMSRLAQAAMNFQLVMNGRVITGPEQRDWFLAQGLVEKLLTLFYSDDIKCNIIVIAHVAFIDTDLGPSKGYPQTLGKALSPKVGQFFNHALLAKSTGQGPQAKRSILTNTSGMVELKNSAPLRVKPEYDLAFGLADYFRDVRNGWAPNSQPQAQVKAPVSAPSAPTQSEAVKPAG